MEIDLSSAVGLVGGMAGLAVLCGGILVFFKGAYNKARIEALRQDVQDYANRDAARQEEHRDDQARIAKLESNVQHLTTENGMLRDLVTQRVEIQQLGGLLTEHHQEAMEAWSERRDSFRVIKEKIE
jgi:hypothetical protein